MHKKKNTQNNSKQSTNNMHQNSLDHDKSKSGLTGMFNSRNSAFVFLFVVFPSSIFTLISWFSPSENSTGKTNFAEAVSSTIILYALYFLIFHICRQRQGMQGRLLYEGLDIKRRINVRDIIVLVLLGGVCLVSFICVQTLFLQIFQSFGYTPDNSELPINNLAQYVLMVFALAFLPAVIEELLFRGLILKGFLEFGSTKAVISSAVLFSLFHLSPAQTVYQFVLGLVLAMVFLRSGNLVYSMILHFVNNFFIITYTYITGDPEQILVYNAATIFTVCFLCVLGILLIVGLVRALKRHSSFQFGKKKFVSFDNIGYLICILLAGTIWILQFIK